VIEDQTLHLQYSQALADLKKAGDEWAKFHESFKQADNERKKSIVARKKAQQQLSDAKCDWCEAKYNMEKFMSFKDKAWEEREKAEANMRRITRLIQAQKRML
jgi:hypothetical protein